jgi:hypothetical protein
MMIFLALAPAFIAFCTYESGIVFQGLPKTILSPVQLGQGNAFARHIALLGKIVLPVR